MKKKTYLLLLTILLFSCKRNDFEIHNLNGNSLAILGHGGMGVGHTYPMNTYESIASCLNLNTDGTEIDIDMTKDGVLVAFHDYELSDLTTASGHIYEKNWDEIREATFKLPLYTNYKIMRLDSMLADLGTKTSKIMAFDCKIFNQDTSLEYQLSFCNALIHIIDRYQLNGHTWIELKSESYIRHFQSLRPDLKLSMYADFETGFRLAKKYHMSGITVPVDGVTKEQVEDAHQEGIMVTVFNTHTHKTNRQAINMNVDMIETDDVRYLIHLLK